MGERNLSHRTDRATRFPLRFPVLFRGLNSPKWLEGTTENISHTGVLFLSPAPLPLETTLQLRLQIAVGTKDRKRPEIHCKGSVVRVEQRDLHETPNALAVAISRCRIVRRSSLTVGVSGNA